VPSLTSRLLPVLLRLTRANRAFVSASEARSLIERRRIRPPRHAPPFWLRRDVVVAIDSSRGFPVYTVVPKDGGVTGTVIYVHGGAWVNEIAVQHWQLAAQIAVQARRRVLVPIYPLVPAGTAERVVTAVADLVLAASTAHGPVALAGDSAGGQIALSAALLLRDEHRVSLPRTVLIAPALDLSLANPLIDDVQPSDPWLGRSGARVMIEHWRGNLPLTDPRVSPLAADLAGLGPLTVFCGTRDILNPDIRLLVGRAAASGVEIEYHEQLGLVHVYPLTPTPEGAAARRIIVDRLRADGGEEPGNGRPPTRAGGSPSS
jgi:acetyl esterase/lipase